MRDEGFMTITGAGPGIMAAGNEGATREDSFGLNITLPFEASANEFIAGDPKLIEFNYFFTRKLAFVKEADAAVGMPGGVGTMDEVFRSTHLDPDGEDPSLSHRVSRRSRGNLLEIMEAICRRTPLPPGNDFRVGLLTLHRH